MARPASRSARIEDAAMLLLVCKHASLAIVQQDFRGDLLTLGWYALVAAYLAAILVRTRGALPPAGRWLPRVVLAATGVAVAVLGFQSAAWLSWTEAQPAGLDWWLLAACAAWRAGRHEPPEAA